MKAEKYVSIKLKKSHRRALALFRSGTAPINLELLRYGVCHVPVDKRKCISCDEVECESHVILKCPLYKDIRELFYKDVCDLLSHEEYELFLLSDDSDKLSYILSSPQCVKLAARTCYDILERRRILTYL